MLRLAGFTIAYIVITVITGVKLLRQPVSLHIRIHFLGRFLRCLLDPFGAFSTACLAVAFDQ